jgi:outer membrane protein insertion porin family
VTTFRRTLNPGAPRRLDRAALIVGLLAAGWLVLAPARALGQPRLPPAPRITAIAITNIGPQAVSEALIRGNIRSKEGENYSAVVVNEDIKNLSATGYFDNVRVSETRTEDGLQLLYVLQGRPKVTEILFTGNTKFAKDKLNKQISTRVGEPLDELKLFRDTLEIKKLYEKAGYPRVLVNYVPTRDNRTGRAAVTFEITETPKVRVVDVQFEGNAAFTDKKLRGQLKTKRHWWLSWLTRSGVLKEDQLEEDRERLGELYRSAGYIDFDLREVRQVQQGTNRVVLQFVLSEGRQYKVGAVGFRGVTLFPTNDLAQKLTMGVGQTFTPQGLLRDTEAVQDSFGTKGYIDTRVQPRRQPNTTTGTMDLLYDVAEGDEVRIEKIEIRGNSKTKDRVIRRELAVYPGETFDMVGVKVSQARLEGLNYFEKVDRQAEQTDIPNRRNLVISVVEKNTGNVQLGAGFSSIDSLIGYVEVSQANFDLFHPPYFTGGGQKARLRLQLGTERKDFQLSFEEPWFLERKLTATVDLFYRDLDFLSQDDTYTQQDAGMRLGLRRALYESRKATLVGGLNYTLQQIDIDLNPNLHGPIVKTVNDPFPGVIVEPANVSEEIEREAGSFLESKVGGSLTWDTRNSYILPNKGQRTELRAELGGGPLGGDVSFYSLELRHSRYIRGLAKGHLLELGARTGVAEEFGDTEFVPIFERYFLGGLDSLRGYRYRDVGPQDEFGEPLGGNTFWYGFAEYSVPVFGQSDSANRGMNVRAAVFYDIGMVYAGSWDWDLGYYADNWGLGLRLNLPIGPLRLDYGVPIHNSSGDAGSGRFQFSVGYQRDF